MFRLSSLLLAGALAAGAALPAAAQSHSAKPLDPVGTYDLDLEREGNLMGVVLTISRAKDGKLSGEVELHGQVVSFDRVNVEDRTITLMSSTDLTFVLTLKNDNTLSGSWSGGMGTGGIQGVRRKS